MGEGKDKKFIMEKILGRDLTFSRTLKFVLVSILCGAVFGGVAFGVYYLASKKTAEAELASMEASLEESVRAHEAELERLSMAAAETETEPEVTQESNAGQAEESSPSNPEESGGETPVTVSENGDTETGETEPPPLDEEQAGFVRSLIAEERENYLYSQEDLAKILRGQQDACANIEKYIVKVSSYISETTWFESTVETERNYGGIVVSKDEEEILILTVDAAAKDCESLKATFFDGTVGEAFVKKTSDRDGWTVLSVAADEIPSDCTKELEAVENASLTDVTEGLPVITAGAPMGVVNSYGFGYVNYVGDMRSEVDGSAVCCYSETSSHPALGTFLMTVDGRLIGFGVAAEEDREASGNRFFIADSCSYMLDNLKKGNDSAWLGITGRDIPAQIAGKKTPQGMYVTGVEENSPAYAAGLKRGDIIVNIGTREIKGLTDYCSFMRNLRPEETITMTIQREAIRSEYKELELEMTAGTR